MNQFVNADPEYPGYSEALEIRRALMIAGLSCAIVYPGIGGSQAITKVDAGDALVVAADTIDTHAVNFIRSIRASRNTGQLIIALSGNADSMRMVEALNAGADEFLIYPLDSRLIAARVEALRRRASEPRLPTGASLKAGPYELVTPGQFAHLREKRIALTPRQFELARLMFANPGRILSSANIERAIWGHELPAASRALSELVSRTRRSLRLCPENGVTVTGLYGRGYRLDVDTNAPRLAPTTAHRGWSEAASADDRAVAGHCG